jgi:hypothetical protein
MGTLLRFAVTSLVVLLLIFVMVAFKAPAGFDWQHVPAATWLTGLGVALGCGFIVAVIELICNLFAPRRGKFGRREPSSIWDHMIP